MNQASLALIIALAAAACSNTDPADSPPDAPPPPPPDAGPPLMITGTVEDALLDSMGNDVLISGATICIDSHPEVSCGHSDGDGNFAMEIPEVLQHPQQPEPLAFVTTAAGHLGEVNHFNESRSVFGWPDPLLRSDSEATAFLATEAGFTYPAAVTGFAVIRVNGNGRAGLAGVTATISPATAKGAVYAQADGTPDPTLASTSANGVILFGNIASGPFTVTINAPGKTCSVGILATSWPAATNQVTGIIAAGAVSDNLFIDCE